MGSDSDDEGFDDGGFEGEGRRGGHLHAHDHDISLVSFCFAFDATLCTSMYVDIHDEHDDVRYLEVGRGQIDIYAGDVRPGLR